MSRIGKLPVHIPAGVTVEIKGSEITVKGPKGTLNRVFHPRMIIEMKDNTVIVKRKSEEKLDKSLHGLTRSLIQNMVKGVSEGYSKKLEINGVGYKALVKGSSLSLNLGFSHPVDMPFPQGVTCIVEENIVTVSGIDNQVVGEYAAEIRALRKPEPYKGKGIRYVGEYVPRKEGKRAGATASS